MKKILFLFLLFFVNPANAETWVTWHSYNSGIGVSFLNQIDISSVYKRSNDAYGNGRWVKKIRGNDYSHHSFWKYQAKCNNYSHNPRTIFMWQDGSNGQIVYRMYDYTGWVPNAGWWTQREYDKGIRAEYDSRLVKALGYTQPESDEAYERLFNILCD